LGHGASGGGAVAVIAERELEEAVAQIIVEDSTRALGDLARAHVDALRSRGTLDVIAMTGSVGKTTTKDLLLQILSEDGPTVAPKLSFNKFARFLPNSTRSSHSPSTPTVPTRILPNSKPSFRTLPPLPITSTSKSTKPPGISK